MQISPYFITDTKTQKVEMENPYVLVFEKKIGALPQLLPLLEAIVKTNRPLLIVAEDVEGMLSPYPFVTIYFALHIVVSFQL